MNLPTFENAGTADLIKVPLKGLLHEFRNHYIADLREAITHCQDHPLKQASRLDILISAIRRRAYMKM